MSRHESNLIRLMADLEYEIHSILCSGEFRRRMGANKSKNENIYLSNKVSILMGN